MTKEDFTDIEEITKRLDVIIYLLLDQKRQAGASNKEIIRELINVGLKDSEIAKILGRKTGYISKERALFKKSNKSKKGVKNG